MRAAAESASARCGRPMEITRAERSAAAEAVYADDLPLFAGRLVVIPCPTDALGVKGCGHAGGGMAHPAVRRGAPAIGLNGRKRR